MSVSAHEGSLRRSVCLLLPLCARLDCEVTSPIPEPCVPGDTAGSPTDNSTQAQLAPHGPGVPREGHQPSLSLLSLRVGSTRDTVGSVRGPGYTD